MTSLRGALGTVVLCFIGAAASGSEPVLSARPGPERIDVLVDGKLFTSYRHPRDWKFPYLWPVIGPRGGQSLTIEKGINHPHHRSLYLACDKVNGANYWQEGLDRGQVFSQGPKVIETGARVVLADECLWTCPGQEPPIKDHRWVIISAPNKDLRLIECRYEFEFLIDTHIDPSNHALFSIEVMPELAVTTGCGTIQDASGQFNEAGTFGNKATWCDYSGVREGVAEGIAILQHPDNPCYPWPFFTRDYGFMSPTPMNWLPPEGIDHKAGERVRMRFLVVAHGGETDEVDLNAIFRDWTETRGGDFHAP